MSTEAPAGDPAPVAISLAVVDDDPMVRAALRMMLGGSSGISVVAEAVDTVSPSTHVVEPAPPVNPLHEAGRELLRKSRDVWSEDRCHPAYARII